MKVFFGRKLCRVLTLLSVAGWPTAKPALLYLWKALYTRAWSTLVRAVSLWFGLQIMFNVIHQNLENLYNEFIRFTVTSPRYAVVVAATVLYVAWPLAIRKKTKAYLSGGCCEDRSQVSSQRYTMANINEREINRLVESKVYKEFDRGHRQIDERFSAVARDVDNLYAKMEKIANDVRRIISGDVGVHAITTKVRVSEDRHCRGDCDAALKALHEQKNLHHRCNLLEQDLEKIRQQLKKQKNRISDCEEELMEFKSPKSEAEEETKRWSDDEDVIVAAAPVLTPEEEAKHRADEEAHWARVAAREAALERVRDPMNNVDWGALDGLPESAILHALRERNSRRDKPTGKYLTVAEKEVGKESLAKLGALWREYYHQRAGTTFSPVPMDLWNLGALSNEEAELPRDDIKNLLQSRRKLYRYKHSFGGRDKIHCEACKTFQPAGHKCWPTNWSTDGKRIGVEKVTLVQQQGKGAIQLKQIPHTDADKLKEAYEQINLMKKQLAEAELVAQEKVAPPAMTDDVAETKN